MIESYTDYNIYMKEIANLSSAAGLLNWDKETYMPQAAASMRSEQLSTLAGLVHEKFTAEEFGIGMEKLLREGDLTELQKVNLERSLEDFEKKRKLDKAFVIKSTKAIAVAFHTWKKARDEDDFTLFSDSLSALVDIKQEEAEKLGYEHHPYEALLDHYEPGMKVELLDRLFEDVRKKLHPLVRQIRDASQVDRSFLYRNFPKNDQWEFSLQVLRDMQYDFEKGRQDMAVHPFTIGLHPDDVRITTRGKTDDFTEMLWSSIHEGGHALYEQGLSSEFWGTPMGSATSLSIHESQSRLWENHVGRSREFCAHYLPILKRYFPDQLDDVTQAGFYAAINRVRADYIRTESDELHYHFHIMIRYEIEKGLIEGSLDVKDVKEKWNENYQTYLDLKSPSDRQGVLQDIHWAHGSFGYFPTYSLGSFYAAQFFKTAGESIPNLEAKISNGQFAELVGWLSDNVFKFGRKFKSEKLCRRITGEPLNIGPFMAYAKKKYGSIYQIDLEN